jgi:hypothetical protein
VLNAFELDRQRSEKLISRSFDRLEKNLEQYGNVLSSKQKQALIDILKTYAEICAGSMNGRFAFALPTGMGKTQSIVAFIAALNELGHDHISIAVCASKVEALCDLKRALEKEGVPSEKIGLVHSYKYDEREADRYLDWKREMPQGYASLPMTHDNEDRQFLLVTHQRVKGKGGIRQFNVYNGGLRDLLIWDESLIVSETFAVSYFDAVRAIGYLDPPDLRKTPALIEALSYLNGCVGIVKKEITWQKANPYGHPKTIRFPRLSDVETYKAALGDKDVVEPLRSLLDLSQEELRVLGDIEQGGGVITFSIVVPSALKNIVVLDASHLIRDLAQMDYSIETAKIDEGIVSYENVTIRQLHYPSGRYTMSKEFERGPKDRMVTEEIADVVKTIPENEGILIFTFKTKSPRFNFRSILESDLKSHGIDTEAEIEVETECGTERRPRIAFLTWGNETSLSKFSYCSNVIIAGVLHRSYIDIGSAMAGQCNDLLLPVSNHEIGKVLQSEMAHCVYQAMSRGSCRVMDGSKTKPMNVWLIHKGDLKSLIEKVMPGVNWKVWQPKYLHIDEATVDKLKDTIKVFIEGLPNDVLKVSTMSIKKSIGLTKVPRMTFTKALRRASEELSDWELRDRSMTKSSCPFLCEA